MPKRILFQGDSITDCGRSRENPAPNEGLGTGYPHLIAAQLCADSTEYEITNRAVSGNRIADTYARWIEDALNLDFDIISILHGLNDVGFGRRLNMGSDRERFRFIYDRMLTEIRESHPNAKLVLMEPFILPVDQGPDVPFGNDIFLEFDEWYGEIRARGQIVKELAEKHGAIFIPLAEYLLDAAKKHGARHYSSDCIHPNAAGHGLIAQRWLEYCGPIL